MLSWMVGSATREKTMKSFRHFLLYVVAIFQHFAMTSCFDYMQEIERRIAQYSHYENWGLSSVGYSASAFISLFLPESIYPQVRDCVNDDHWTTCMTNTMIYTLKNQTPLTVIIVIGLLMTAVLIFFPYFVSISRRKYHYRTDGPETPRKFVCLSVFVAMCAAVAAFAVVIAVWSSIRAYFTLQAPFKFVHYAVVLASFMKTVLRHNFESRIHDISRSAHNQTMLLYDINEEIFNAFTKSTKVFLNPFPDIASSMHWQIVQAKYTLEHQKSSLQSLINGTNSSVGELLSNLTTAVNSLKKIDNTSQLEPILKLSKLNLSEDEVKMFDEPINTLTEATKVNLPSSIEAVSVYLGKVARNISFDPDNLISDLNQAAFKEQQQIGDKVAKYIAIVNMNIQENDREAVFKHLSEMEDSFLKTPYFVQCVLVTIIAVTSVCMLVSFSAFFGVIGMDGCTLKSKRTRAATCCFKVLRMSLYFISFLVFICCAASFFMFFMTAITLQYCDAWRDHSFFTATVDNLVLKNKTQWFNPFAFHDYGSSMKTQIIKCQEDNQYFPPLPDPLINMSAAETVKKNIDTTNVTNLFEKGLKDIPEFNLSSPHSVLSNLSHALDKLNFSSIFQPLKEFLNNVTNTDGLNVLTKIKEDPNSPSDASKQAAVALGIFESLVQHLENVTSQGGPFNITIESVHIDLQTVSLQMDYLKWTASALHNFLVNDSMRIYKEVLNNITTKKVDGIFFDMLYEASLLRKAMSTCRILLLFCEKGDTVLCNIVAQPMAVSWLGFFLLSVFLTAAIQASKTSVKHEAPPNDSTEAPVELIEFTKSESSTHSETSTPLAAHDQEEASAEHKESTQSEASSLDVQHQPKASNPSKAKK